MSSRSAHLCLQNQTTILYLQSSAQSAVACHLVFIVGIVKASKVNGLYYAKQYEAANLAAQEAKKWSLIGMGVGLVINIIYWLVYGATLIAMLGM